MPEETKLTDVMRGASFIPETKRCSELFAEMTASKTQMAIIVDEYGGTEGLVTMEDLVEAIVGNIQDEYDNEEEEICRVNDNTFTVDGTTSIDEISDSMGVTFPEGDYDTVSGLVIEHLGHIPKPGEHPTVNIENVRFTVEQVENRRIDKVLVVKPTQLPEKNRSRIKEGRSQLRLRPSSTLFLRKKELLVLEHLRFQLFQILCPAPHSVRQQQKLGNAHCRSLTPVFRLIRSSWV